MTVPRWKSLSSSVRTFHSQCLSMEIAWQCAWFYTPISNGCGWNSRTLIWRGVHMLLCIYSVCTLKVMQFYYKCCAIYYFVFLPFVMHCWISRVRLDLDLNVTEIVAERVKHDIPNMPIHPTNPNLSILSATSNFYLFIRCKLKTNLGPLIWYSFS